MAKFRVAVRALAAAVLFFGMAFAAVRSGSQAWHGAVYTITVAALAMAAVAARRRGPGGVFWGGFAVFGWAYFLVALGPQYPHAFAAHITSDMTYAEPNPNLLTTWWVGEAVARALGTDYYTLHFSTHYLPGPVDVRTWIRRVTIIHALSSWPLGLVGGVVAQLLAGDAAERGGSPRAGGDKPGRVAGGEARAMFRISALILVAAVLFLGLAFAAIRSGSQTWHGIAYTVTAAALATAAVAARRRGRGGVFWGGFALFGWAYFVVALGPNYPHIYREQFYRPEETHSHPNPNLATTRWVEEVAARVLGTDYESLRKAELTNGLEVYGWIRRVSIIHVLLSCPVGFVGGVVARFLVGDEAEGG
jgi:hypothetical protein